MADTVTIPNVELVKAGTWRPGTQPDGLTITVEQIAAAALAAADAEVDAAPIKIGHDAKLDAELGDSAPALGWVRNVRVKPGDPGTLIGDLTDIPAKLAAIMPKAFRRRSAELGFDVRTPGGKLYSMALSALSLLGAKPPAVKGLADVTALYGLGEGVTAGTRATVHLAAGVDDGERAAGLADSVAGVDRLGLPADQRDALVAQLEAAAGVTTPTIPEPVKDDGHNGGDRPAHTKEPTTMDEVALRKLLGVEADADIEATVKDLLAAKATEPKLDADGNPITEPKLDADGKPVTEPATGEPGKELVGAGAAQLSAAVVKELKDAGLTVLSDAALSTLADGAKAGASAAAKLAAAETDAALAAAVKAGKITPAESEHFATALFGPGKDPEAGKALLAAMTPGKVPTQELGAATAALSGDEFGTADQWDAFEADLLDIPAADKK